jgi:hypothetical protein
MAALKRTKCVTSIGGVRGMKLALMVRGLAADEVDDVARILRFFEPLRVDMISEAANSP